MKTLQNIPNVLKFDVFYDKLLILNTNNHLLIEGNLFDESVQNFTIQDCIYIQKTDQLKIVDKNKNQIKIDGKFYLSHSWKNGDDLIVLKVDNSDDYYSIHTNGRIDKVSWSNSFIKKITNEYFFSLTYKIITCNNISDGTELWQKEFSDNIQKLEVWKEKVVLVARHGNYITTLYALDAETGNVIWENQEMSADIKIIDNKVYTTVINHTSIKLVELNPLDVSQSIEYDLTKIIFNELGKTENFKYTIQDHLIYISVISRKILLVIDFLKSELLWRYDFTPPAQPRTYWIDEPKVSGNRLYVMDEENTLHIFEREEPS